MNRKLQWAAIVCGLALLFVAGAGIRRHVLDAQYAAWGRALPFTLESALQFRRIMQVYETGTLPNVDHEIQYPRGIVTRETDTVGAEYIYAWAARLFPSSIAMMERIRWIELLWFCAGIPFMALWIGWWTRSFWSGAFAGAFYAIAPSSIVRSTGQELSHENASLPFLVGHLAFDALAEKASSPRMFFLASILSAVFLGLALILWDLMQFYLLLWSLVAYTQMISGRLGREKRLRWKWLIQLAALLVLGITNPYLRAHWFCVSPAMLLAYGTLAGLALKVWMDGAGHIGKGLDWFPLRGLLPALVGLAPVLAVTLLPYRKPYGHFMELLAAKILFLNQKPIDPSLLTFSQRIMWVPSLHSADLQTAFALFPAILVLTLLAAVVLWALKIQSYSGVFRLLFFYAVSLLAFFLFVRFHVFLAVFAAGLLGLAASWGLSRSWWLGTLAVLILAVGLVVESGAVLGHPERWGRPNYYYDEAEELAVKLKETVAPEPVLANFGISASILAYGDCPIVLHPKFESEEIRERVRTYGDALFKGPERGFRDWADEHGARYYVHAMGELSTIAPDQQMRYMVNCLVPASNAAVRVFEEAPDRAKYFKFLWGNRKYRLFQIHSRRDEERAARSAREAEEALGRGDLNLAEQKAVEALQGEPWNEQALEVLRHVGALRDQGFSYGL